MRRLLALAACTLAVLLAGPAAHAQDSDAPPGALPHWIPTEDWVYEHWLPYDETRLYRVLRTDRGRIWRHLRDDAAHDLAQLARRRGLTAAELADRLVAPRRAAVDAGTFARLRSRALRTITQGHLAQHILFHSLHQRTLVDRARWIFGVSGRRLADLRVDELSPLEIARLSGRSAVAVRGRAARALRATAARGVRGGALTRAQAERLLRRQLRQLPRWLGQRRNNGPPRTLATGRPSLPPADWGNHPTISADGTRVAFDAYRATIPDARRLGEIRVVVADLARGGRLLETSHATGVTPGVPRSAYHSALAADGSSVVFELAEGNRNYAKRYGQMRVAVHDLGAGRTHAVSHRPGARRRRGRRTTRPCPATAGPSRSRRPTPARPACGWPTASPGGRGSSGRGAPARRTSRACRPTGACSCSAPPTRGRTGALWSSRGTSPRGAPSWSAARRGGRARRPTTTPTSRRSRPTGASSRSRARPGTSASAGRARASGSATP
jgi:hypothetical protein